MRALVLTGVGEFSVTEKEKPACPDGGILIKVKACGLCGSDIRNLYNGHQHISYPRTIGHEVCGIVEEISYSYSGDYKYGERIAVGPMVYCGQCEFCMSGRHELCESTRELGQQWDGGFAEYMAIPKEAFTCGSISRVPDTMKDEHATLSEPASSCVNAQEKAGIGMGDTVLIIGSGPIGCMHISLAKSRGAKCVIVADVSADRLELCKKFGADITINSAIENLQERIAQITNGKGVEVIITANPVGATQVQAVELAKKGGRVVFFGGLPKDNSRPGIDTNLIHYKGLHVMGVSTFNPRHYRLAVEAISSGKIPAELLVTEVFKLEDFKKGLEIARSGKALKIVFMP